MKSGFVELVIKNALAGRPVTKSENLNANRYRPIDLFRSFINSSLPKMEQAIQIEMLKKNLIKIKQEELRKELINAYLRRLYRLRAYEIDDIKSYKELKAMEPEQIRALKDPTIFKQINDHNQFDVGSYIMFQEQEMKKFFKHKFFGRYARQEYLYTKKFGVQIREQSVSIGEMVKVINKIKGEKVDWSKFAEMSVEKKREYVDDQNNYPALFIELSNTIYEYVQKYRDLPDYYRVWGSSTIQDIIINSVLQHPESLQNSVEIALEIVEAVMKLEPLPSSNDFSYWHRKMPGHEEIQTKIELPPNVRYFCRTPSLKSFFLGGQGGTGRSMILAYLSMLGFRNNWIVINVPNVHDWTFDTKAKYIRAYNGLYLINEHAVEWLDQFLTANSHILSQKPVNMEIYGRCDITGVPDTEADPVQNIYYHDRKAYFNEIADKFEERITEVEEEKRNQAKKRLTDVLKEPKFISQIAEAGMANPEFATCAMGQILRQVYALDHPTMECVDSFSHLYRATVFPSFRYYNDRDLYGKVPPYHIAHCRMFVNLDGHKIKNGFKVVAASNYPFYKHKFNIKQMMFPENYEHKVRNLTKREFLQAGQYNIIHDWWLADELQRLNISYAYTITQGNWGYFQEYMSLGHYY